MSDRKSATHDDAQLVLKLYELRRDETMRKARDWFAFEFFPESMEHISEIYSSRGEQNAYLRMVTTYWDMAASFCAHGALDVHLFLESANEMMMVWAKLEKFVPAIRSGSGLHDYLKNIEQVIKMVDWAPDRVRWLQERMSEFRKMRDMPKAGERD
jgi:hypothetical protein